MKYELRLDEKFQPQLKKVMWIMAEKTEQLNKFTGGMKALKNKMPDQISGFNALLKSELAPGLLDFKTKEIISVALACYARCDYCIAYHVHSALKAGASAEEIMEAAMVSVVFGGGPTMSYIATTLKDCIEEFSKPSED